MVYEADGYGMLGAHHWIRRTRIFHTHLMLVGLLVRGLLLYYATMIACP